MTLDLVMISRIWHQNPMTHPNKKIKRSTLNFQNFFAWKKTINRVTGESANGRKPFQIIYMIDI